MKPIFTIKTLVFLIIVMASSACALSLPSFRRTSQNTDVSISNTSSQVEALKRSEYDVLRTTTGKSRTAKFYLLFFPIGRHKSSEELYENAYFNAVDNLEGADGLLLPRQKNRKLVIPLLLINYYQKEVEVSGLAISVKGKTLPSTKK
jgi:hypothetical protein